MDRIFSRAGIKFIASVLPSEVLSMEMLGALYGEDTVSKISRATGIKELHAAPPGRTSADYCIEAARKIFGEGDIVPSDIDAVVLVTETPDYIVPHTSAIIQHRLGISTKAPAFDINYGCAGYVYGVFQSFLLVEMGYARNVLLCVGDTETRYIHKEDRATRMVIGDAGTATVISAVQDASPSAFSFFTDGEGASSLIIPAGGARKPKVLGKTDVLHYDKAGNGRTDENLYMDGMEVMEFALHDVKPVIESALGELGLDLDQVDLFALHQANEFIVKSIAKLLKTGKKNVPFGAGRTGNTSCASIPVMLSELYPGTNAGFRRVVLCGFGTGLSCAAGVVDLSHTRIMPTEEF